MRKVIIIGATSGIGRELAKIYARSGAIVGATGRRQELLDSLAREYPEQIFGSSFDVQSADAVTHVENLIGRLQGLDLLIYNAGYGDISEKLDWVIDKQTIDTNVNGFAAIVHFAFNFFVGQGQGQLAAISSVASVRGSGLAPAYAASKAFMSTYMEGLYLKSKKLKANVQVTDVQPGFVDSKMARGHNRFWVASVEEAARQISLAIDRKKWRAYVTKRWRIVAWLLKRMPVWIYRHIG